MAPRRTAKALDAFRDALGAEEAVRRGQGLQRALSYPEGVDFASNDYLGLSRHPAVGAAMRRALEDSPFGAPASRLLRGNLPGHRALEERLAAWKGTEEALLFTSGYSANLGTLPALIRREDRALSDALNHASLIDGLRLSGCRREVYPHLDLAEVERLLLEPHAGGRTFIVTETLFSMDGDTAPLGPLSDLAERHGALLVLDEAHATGLHGDERGSGLAEEHGLEGRAAAIISTCGKALGLWGAFVAGPREVIDCLVNRARSFIFSTAPPPVLLAGIGAALDLVAGEPERRLRVRENAERLREGLRARGIEASGEGPIVPVILGPNERALRVAAEVRDAGFDVRAVRPPSVPAGTARLRISVHADRAPAEIDGLCAALGEALSAPPPAAHPPAGHPAAAHRAAEPPRAPR